uniref:CD164 sialomucin-like 2 protein n=1 Tax=Pygocentrus nattereri TaxID=42514 RepID=A0AAR2IYH9_PYGNA
YNIWHHFYCGDCSQLSSCDRCTSGDPTLNMTRCIWRSCDNGERAHVEKEYYSSSIILDISFSHSLYNDTSSCPSEDPKHTHTHISHTSYFSQASFDLSSFIGGIILVLVLQAGAFFAMRFLKTKDSTYETM